MIVGFTGTRRGMTTKQRRNLRALLEQATEFHHGDCVGADEEACVIAREMGIRTVSHPPLNEKGRAFTVNDVVMPSRGYLDRDHDIVDASDRMIAAPLQANEVLRSGT
jgi:hypothetical protein